MRKLSRATKRYPHTCMQDQCQGRRSLLASSKSSCASCSSLGADTPGEMHVSSSSSVEIDKRRYDLAFCTKRLRLNILHDRRKKRRYAAVLRAGSYVHVARPMLEILNWLD